MEENETLYRTEPTDDPPAKNVKDAKIQTNYINFSNIGQNCALHQFPGGTYLTPIEDRLMQMLKRESKKGSRQNKIISLIMSNNDFNVRVQNMHHSNRLHGLLDSEYMLPLYYYNLYQKIDALLAEGDEFEYGSEPTDDAFDDNEDFSEVDFEDSDEIFASTEKYKNLPRNLQNPFSSLKKGNSFLRKPLVHKFGSNKSIDKVKSGARNPSTKRIPEIDVEQEQIMYEETKAMLEEEMDGFDDPEEFEAELPRRIQEAIKNLNDRLKYLKKDEFGDPIIEEGYHEEPQGKNLQVSALRLTNLLGMLFKKNPLPEFQEQVQKLMKNFAPSGKELDIEDVKSKIMTGKGIGGILGMLQKNMKNTNAIAKNIAGNNPDYPPGFNPNRRRSSVLRAESRNTYFRLCFR